LFLRIFYIKIDASGENHNIAASPVSHDLRLVQRREGGVEQSAERGQRETP
jgi:hypothetical protein